MSSEPNSAVAGMGEVTPPADPVFSIQPTRESIVWQQNRLAEARYKLNPREQKLLLYVISMIEPEAQEFGRCKVGVQGYAEVTGLQSDDLYQELRDTALSIREKNSRRRRGPGAGDATAGQASRLVVRIRGRGDGGRICHHQALLVA